MNKQYVLGRNSNKGFFYVSSLKPSYQSRQSDFESFQVCLWAPSGHKSFATLYLHCSEWKSNTCKKKRGAMNFSKKRSVNIAIVNLANFQVTTKEEESGRVPGIPYHERYGLWHHQKMRQKEDSSYGMRPISKHVCDTSKLYRACSTNPGRTKQAYCPANH